MASEDPTRVVTVFAVRDGRVLVLQRDDDTREYPGRWSGASGRIDPGETPRQAALRELEEETGLSGEVEAAGQPRTVRDGDRRFEVHPFRVRVDDGAVRLGTENRGFDWVDPVEIRRRETVPRLRETWERVAP